MLRLYLLLAIILIFWGYWLLPRLGIHPWLWLRGQVRRWWLPLLVGIVLILLLTGRLNILIALVSVVGAFLARLLPWLVRYAPYLQKFWHWSKSSARSNSATGVNTTAMTREQALAILGLNAGATEEEIIQAHRRLMARVHPDKGGSDFLAAQINLARKILLE